jgi:hypothetical protein
MSSIGSNFENNSQGNVVANERVRKLEAENKRLKERLARFSRTATGSKLLTQIEKELASSKQPVEQEITKVDDPEAKAAEGKETEQKDEVSPDTASLRDLEDLAVQGKKEHEKKKQERKRLLEEIKSVEKEKLLSKPEEEPVGLVEAKDWKKREEVLQHIRKFDAAQGLRQSAPRIPSLDTAEEQTIDVKEQKQESSPNSQSDIRAQENEKDISASEVATIGVQERSKIDADRVSYNLSADSSVVSALRPSELDALGITQDASQVPKKIRSKKSIFAGKLNGILMNPQTAPRSRPRSKSRERKRGPPPPPPPRAKREAARAAAKAELAAAQEAAEAVAEAAAQTEAEAAHVTDAAAQVKEESAAETSVETETSS